MKPIGRILAVMFSIIALGTLVWGQTTFYSTGNVAANTLSNWNSNTDGVSGTAPGNFTTSGFVFIIQTGHSMTTSATWTLAAGVTVEIQNGGILTATNLISSLSFFQVDAGGKYVHNATGSSTNGSANDFPGTTRTLASTSTIEMQKWANGGTGPTGLPSGISWGNLTINVAALGGSWNQTANVSSIAGTLTVLATGGSAEFRLTGSAALTASIGNISVSGGTLTMGGGAGKLRVNVGGNISVSGGTLTQTNTSSEDTRVNVAGDVVISSGTYNLTTVGNFTDTLAVAGKLDISGGVYNVAGSTSSNTTTIISGNFLLSGTGAFTPGNTGNYAMTVGGNLSISGGTYTWSVGTSGSKTYTVNLAGNFSMTGGSLVYSNTSGTTNGSLNFTGGSASVSFSQSAGTFTPNATASGVNWAIANGKTVTFNDAFTLPSTTTARTFTVQSGGQLVVGAAMTNNGTLVDAGTITNNSTILINGTFQLNEGGIVANTALTYGSSGTLSYNGTSVQTMTNAEFPAASGPFNLTINNSAGVTLNAPRTVTGTLTLTSGILSGSAANLTLGSGATISRSDGTLNAAPAFTGGTNLIYTGSAGLITTGFEKPVAVNNLTINNALGVTLAAPLFTVSGTVTLTSGLLSGCTANLTLGSGATISRSGGSLDAAPTFGAITNVTYTTPTPLASITTSFELPTSVNNLTINNSSGVTLSAITAVGGILTMTSGNINLNSFAMSLGSSTSSTGTLTYTSGFLTGSGSFTRWFGTSAITLPSAAGQFPLGISTNNRNLWIGGTPGTGGTVSVQYNDASSVSTVSITEGGTYVNQYGANWMVTTGNGFAGTAFGLQIQGSGIPGISAVADLNITGVNSVAAGTYVAPSGTPAAPILQRSGIADQTALASTYYISSLSGSPLPVELASFTATANRLTAELHWSTATEVNNFGFEIERKTSTTGWTKVGFVAGAGTSTSLHNYTYTDNVGQAGMYEYRIKQIDKNGGFKYSSTMQVEVGAVAKVFSLGANYPNPFNPTTNIEFTVPNDGKVVLKVYNMLGQEVATLFDGEATAGRIMKTSFDASRLSSGVYFSRLEMAGQALVKRMVFLK